MKKSKIILFLFSILFLSVSFSTLSAQKPQRPQKGTPIREAPPVFSTKFDQRNFKHFNYNGTGQQNMNAYLLCYLSCMVYTQNLLNTPSNADHAEVTRLNNNQSDFEETFKSTIKFLFPVNQEVEMKWIHRSQPNNGILGPGYFDPEAMAISTKDYIIIAFRGTDRVGNSSNLTYNWGEWAHNFDFIPVQSEDLPGKVHRGFYESTKLIKAELADWIIDHNPQGRKKIWLTGHSLGGAQAQLLASHLIANGQIPHGVFVFASPHVGDHSFVTNLNNAIGGESRIQRFEFNGDPATQVPNLYYYARAGIRNYFHNINHYEYNVRERLIRTAYVEVLAANACFHYDGWYLNACYNLLTNSQKAQVQAPIELPNKDHYFGCNLTHESLGNGTTADEAITMATWTYDQWVTHVEIGMRTHGSVTLLVSEMYSAGALATPDIVRIAKAAEIGLPALITGIAALGEGQLEIAIPALYVAYKQTREIVEALDDLMTNEAILEHLGNAGVAAEELKEIGLEVLGMTIGNINTVLNAVVNNFTPVAPSGLQANVPYYIKHTITSDVRKKDLEYLGNPTGGAVNSDPINLYSASGPQINSVYRTWKIVPIPGPFARYRIVLDYGKDRVLQVDRRDDSLVHLWDDGAGFTNQDWDIKPVGDGSYTIQNVRNGKYLYVTNDGTVVTNNPGNYVKHYWKFEQVH